MRLSYRKTRVHHAGTWQLPLLVRSAASGEGAERESSRCVFFFSFLPLIQRGNSERPSAMPNYFCFYGYATILSYSTGG